MSGAEGSSTYLTRLDSVRADVVRLAGMAAEAVARSTRCLLDGDLDAARGVVEGDDALDELSVHIEEECHQLLALHNPMAGDLRAVVTALKLAGEFERCGDLAVNIAKAGRRVHDLELPPRTRGLIERMSAEAVSLMRASLEAYADGDAARASALDDLDDELDDLQRTFVESIFEAHQLDGVDMRVGVQLALVGRYYERLGDHAVNVAERAHYMVTGWLPGHAGAARAAVRDRLGAADHDVDAGASAEEGVSFPPAAKARALDALDHLPIGVVICDEDGAVVFRNRFATRFVDARHGDALVEAGIETLRTAAADADGERRTRTLELAGPPARTYSLQMWPVPDGRVITVADTSEQQRVEALRRDFVANVGHELRTPVGALAVLSETLADEVGIRFGGGDDEAEVSVIARLTARISQEADRLGATIDDLLELSRLEAGDLRRTERVPIAEVITAAVEATEPSAHRRGVAIAVDMGPLEAEDVSVEGDRRQLVSAVANLLDNAVKYSEPGASVEVSGSLGGPDVVIDVRDEGVGIPEADQARVFERFYRVDRSRRRETGGTGLGLAIVRHVAINHGGSVSLVSREGEGSTFSLRFPRR